MKKECLNIKGKAYYQSMKMRYLNAAKEASGDRVLKEYNLQFAEHYSRIISEKFSPQAPQQHSQPQSQISQSTTQDNAQPEEVIENKTKCTNRKVSRRTSTKKNEDETVS